MPRPSALVLPTGLDWENQDLAAPGGGAGAKKKGLKKATNPKQWSGKKIKILAGGKILEVRALQGDECQGMARALRQSHHWLINKQLYVPEEDKIKTI